eukprot:m.431568 g.431568  ORF g.431568 m.431568 type:complete len:146 (+) comp21405_c0_seq3:369-806(+)
MQSPSTPTKPSAAAEESDVLVPDINSMYIAKEHKGGNETTRCDIASTSPPGVLQGDGLIAQKRMRQQAGLKRSATTGALQLPSTTARLSEAGAVNNKVSGESNTGHAIPPLTMQTRNSPAQGAHSGMSPIEVVRCGANEVLIGSD